VCVCVCVCDCVCVCVCMIVCVCVCVLRVCISQMMKEISWPGVLAARNRRIPRPAWRKFFSLVQSTLTCLKAADFGSSDPTHSAVDTRQV